MCTGTRLHPGNRYTTLADATYVIERQRLLLPPAYLTNGFAQDLPRAGPARFNGARFYALRDGDFVNAEPGDIGKHEGFALILS